MAGRSFTGTATLSPAIWIGRRRWHRRFRSPGRRARPRSPVRRGASGYQGEPSSGDATLLGPWPDIDSSGLGVALEDLTLAGEIRRCISGIAYLLEKKIRSSSATRSAISSLRRDRASMWDFRHGAGEPEPTGHGGNEPPRLDRRAPRGGAHRRSFHPLRDARSGASAKDRHGIFPLLFRHADHHRGDPLALAALGAAQPGGAQALYRADLETAPRG